ncbi:hypothetical protein HYPBUDRAFT_222797 [Hyphopichia burtonii NRRL Y-1933]|uniref:Uncharacterized protein n=1 Tax=Hyphopichia burtonii NRRL Y-1933 TaxID=984485 RepID=A0A1E4RFV1_9ASCO|nr:hypothetical protein HYPBUDRAFT_222797 [Hyphopichia burtonii NRRL Y-1933]ODV66142.1 hypothetical protein HYPBUDRAFT_222797 [Hyphopichia burtonii NRRL Y-1933]
MLVHRFFTGKSRHSTLKHSKVLVYFICLFVIGLSYQSLGSRELSSQSLTMSTNIVFTSETKICI